MFNENGYRIQKSIGWYSEISCVKRYRFVKSTNKGQSDTIKELRLKKTKLEKKEKVTTYEEAIARLDERVSSLVYLERKDWLKAKKLDDLEQYGCRESLRFNGFQTKQNESSENCAKMMKQYIRNTLKVEADDNDFNDNINSNDNINNKNNNSNNNINNNNCKNKNNDNNNKNKKNNNSTNEKEVYNEKLQAKLEEIRKEKHTNF